ncbi:MAG: hypothetical protein E6552_10245, partial [Sutterella wadsworthensis]|nr:hypothetical protein [Sutterella wadsworthensis]
LADKPERYVINCGSLDKRPKFVLEEPRSNLSMNAELRTPISHLAPGGDCFEFDFFKPHPER